MHSVRQQWRVNDFDLSAESFASVREPKIPPRLTNAESVIGARNDGHVEEEGVEACPYSLGLMAIYIHSPREGHALGKAKSQRSRKPCIGDDLAIRVDDA